MTIYKSRTSPGEAVEVARNKYLYPSFEKPSGTVAIRTNLDLDPSFESGSSHVLAAAPANATVSSSTTIARTGSRSLRSIVTATGAGTALLSTGPGSAYVVSPGDPFSVSIYAVKPAGPAVSLRARIFFRDASNAVVGGAIEGPPVSAGSNFVRLSVSATVPATAVKAQVNFNVASDADAIAGDIYYFDDVLPEKTLSVLPYFDGSTPAAGDFEYVWSGTENASTSIMRAKGILGVSDDGVYQSQEWAAEGTHSAFVPTGKTLTVALAEPSTVKVIARSAGQTMTVGGNAVTSVGSDETLTAYGDTSVVLGPGYWDILTPVPGVYTGPPFTGSTAPHGHTGYGWDDVPDQSASIQYESDFNIGDQWWVLDADDNVIAVRLWDGTGWNLDGILPVPTVSQREILYGARTTAHRYELLSHDYTTGIDSLIGYLDGVKPGGTLSWSAAKSVKKSGNLTVVDLDTAQPGMLRIRDLNLLTTRVRPVKVIEGLPEMPLGIYEMSATPESWSDTGRTYSVELLDKSTVLVQDEISETFVAEAGVPILSIVKDLIESAGELISIDASETGTLANARVWEVGTPKLRIINDLLTVLNYNALWVDGPGNFRATPYVRPAARSIRYTVLNDESGQRLVRELVDGEEAIYSPDWTRDQDLYGIPNRVIAVQSGTGEDEPLIGIADNTDANDPFSIPNRGVRARTLTDVDVPDGTEGEIEAALEAIARRTLIAASSPQSVAEVTSLPIPLELLDAVRFAHGPAGLDARHTVQAVEIGLSFDSTMRLSLLRVVDV